MDDEYDLKDVLKHHEPDIPEIIEEGRSCANCTEYKNRCKDGGIDPDDYCSDHKYEGEE